MDPINNKYTKWYYHLIENRRINVINEQFEKHHIIPKSLGGSNLKDNIVKLTPKEHYIAHLLLTKMFIGEARHKMSFAFNMMLAINEFQENRYKPSSRMYSYARLKVGLAAKKLNKGRIAWNRGIPRPDHVKDAVRNANKGRIAWNRGIPRTEDEKIKMSEARKACKTIPVNKGKKSPTKMCKHCNKEVPVGNYGRWHGENCLSNPKKNNSIRITNFTVDNPGKIKVTCEYCNKIVSSPNYKRWHGVNCKSRK